MIGVLGHLEFPGLEGKEVDQILPKMMHALAPEWLSALIMTGALAAFMSTMDSQLLSLSTIFTRDIYKKIIHPSASFKMEVTVGKIIVVILASIGLLIAFLPPDSIFVIVRYAGKRVLGVGKAPNQSIKAPITKSAAPDI